MKTLILSLALLTATTNAFAAATLVCSAEDGSEIQATVGENNQIFDIRMKVRSGPMKNIPGATAALFVTSLASESEKVESLVLKDAKGRIIAVVASGSFVDKTGTYSVDQCEVSY